MLKRGFILLLLLIFSSLVFADDFSGFKYSGDEFKVGADNFSIRLSLDEKVLVFKNSFEGMNVGLGNCDSTVYYKYCFYNSVVDFNNNLGKLHDYTGEVMPALNISIISIVPDLIIKRTASKTTPNEYEEIKIEVNITNNGKKQAKLIYVENISSPAFISSCKGCMIIDGIINYNSLIYPGEEEIFSYTLNPANSDSITLTPILSFESETLNGSLVVKSIKITPKKSFSISYVGSSKLDIESEVSSDFVFKNNDLESSLTFESYLLFDDSFSISSSESGVNVENEKIVFSGSLKPGESKEFTVKILPKFSGKKSIVFFNDYNIGSDKILGNSTVDLEFIVTKPVIDFLVDYNMFSDRLNEISLSLDNSESKNSFKDIHISISVGDVIDENFIVPFLKYIRVLDVYKNGFTIISNVSKSVDFKLNVTYKTLFDEELSDIISKKIEVKPISMLFDVEHNFEDFEQDEGSLLVSVFVKNNGDSKIIFNVSDVVSGARVLSFDGREITDYTRIAKNEMVYIDPLSKKQVYSYMIKKGDANITLIKTSILTSGVKSSYLIEFDSIIDFEKKTAVINNTKTTMLSEIVEEVVEDSGVLEENIKIEETYVYDVQEIKETIAVPETKEETKESAEKESLVTEQENAAPKKKSFFRKILDVILSFF